MIQVEKIHKIRFIPSKFFLNGNLNPATAAIQVLLLQGRWKRFIAFLFPENSSVFEDSL